MEIWWEARGDKSILMRRGDESMEEEEQTI